MGMDALAAAFGFEFTNGFVFTSKVNAYTNFNTTDQFNPIYHYNQNILVYTTMSSISCVNFLFFC